MHGSVLDWLITNTVKDAATLFSGEEAGGTVIADYATYPFRHLKEQPNFTRVLDIGGQDVNGSPRTYNFFGRGPSWLDIVGNPEYTSIDIIKGAGVHMQMDAHAMSFPDNHFDLVLCFEVLEHDSDPAQTLKEAYRVLQPNCPLILTCAEARRPAHDIHGGAGQPYNFIKASELTTWLQEAGFQDFTVLNWDGDLRVYAVKEKPSVNRNT